MTNRIDKEKWAILPDPYQKYEVSTRGRIKSNAQKLNIILKTWTNSWGYEYVGLYSEGNKKSFRVHRLVLKAFKGDSDLHFSNYQKDLRSENENSIN